MLCTHNGCGSPIVLFTRFGHVVIFATIFREKNPTTGPQYVNKPDWKINLDEVGGSLGDVACQIFIPIHYKHLYSAISCLCFV